MISNLLKSERRNVYLYYLTSVGMSCWFIASNWVYFLTKFMTYGQLGWVDAIGFGFALLLEIPSGAIADLLGKRKTILFGMIAGFIGVMIMTFSGNLVGMTIGWMITQICYAFYSGAAEALVYDSLKDLKEEDQFDHVISKSSSIESITGAIATLIGGFVYYYNNQLPHFLWGLGFLFGSIASYFFIEPKIDTEKFSFRTYFKQIFTGIKELTQTELKYYIGFFFALVGVYYLYSWGFVRPAIATSFGFFSKEQAIILPALTIFGAFIVRLIPTMKKYVSDLTGLVTLSLFMSVGFVLSFFNLGWYGLIPMFLIAVAGHLATPWISIIVNKRIESKDRATTLSTISLLNKIPYVVIVVTVGKMVENGTLPIFNLWTGIIVITTAVISYLIIKTRS